MDTPHVPRHHLPIQTASQKHMRPHPEAHNKLYVAIQRFIPQIIHVDSLLCPRHFRVTERLHQPNPQMFGIVLLMSPVGKSVRYFTKTDSIFSVGY